MAATPGRNATGIASSGAELRVTRVDDQEVSAKVLPKQLEEVVETSPASTDMARVSIVLEKESTLEAIYAVVFLDAIHYQCAAKARSSRKRSILP